MECRFVSVLSSARLLKRRPIFRHVVRSVNLSFKHFGESLNADGISVIVMHGLLGSKKHMEGIAKTISNITKDAVITLDLRNHGDSPHTNSHKYTEMASDVEELLVKQNIKKPILIGHSMGGRTAMSLALMKPTKIAGIIVVDISPVSTCADLIYEKPKILEAMYNIDFSKQKKVSHARKYAKKLLRKKITDDKILKAILSNINIRRDGVLGWSLNLDVLIKHFKYIAAFPKSLLDQIYTGPALFIGGQHSDYLPPDDLPRIREIFPNATVTYVAKTGHMVYNDDPKNFMELVITFIKTNRKQKVL